jgi:23S rRNA pseudouridine1911/1915/1917 synthase
LRPDTARFTVGSDGDGRRLDAWLAATANLSRGEAQGLIEAGEVTVEGGTAAKAHKLRAGEAVVVNFRAPEAPPDTSAPFRILYEDEHLAVVDKPAGVVVHPAPGSPSGTLVEALSSRMPLAPSAGEGRPGVVHRLDKDTSGLIVVAKTDAAYRGLVAALGAREVARTYVGLAAGTFALPEGRIEAPMGRSQRDRTKMGVVPGGREAVTEFRVLEAFPGASLLEIRLRTGRTHQIRVHLAHIHHPLVGDPVYGRSTAALARSLGLKRPFLHAERLRFVHPVTGETIDVTSPLPADLKGALEAIRAFR